MSNFPIISISVVLASSFIEAQLLHLVEVCLPFKRPH